MGAEFFEEELDLNEALEESVIDSELVSLLTKDELERFKESALEELKKVRKVFQEKYDTLRNEVQSIDDVKGLLRSKIFNLFRSTEVDLYLLAIADKIESLIELEARGAKAFKDHLTGLKNRLSIHNELEVILDLMIRAIDRGEDVVNLDHFALLYIDLNDFKVINDEHGHENGDIALIQVADAMRSTFSRSDILGRLGGDELIVLMRRVNSNTQEEGVPRAVERLRNNVENMVKRPDNKTQTISVGIYYSSDFEFPEDVSHLRDGAARNGYIKKIIQEILSESDKRMYEDKERVKGKN